MGGVWERLVKSVKTTLQALVADRLLTDEELLSYLAEVEKVLNDRPLTKMGSDPRDEVPITPSDFEATVVAQPSRRTIRCGNAGPPFRSWPIASANDFRKNTYRHSKDGVSECKSVSRSESETLYS